MKNNKLFYFMLFCAFLSPSCEDKQVSDDIPTFIIDIDKVTEAMASDYFESIDYLWLEDESDPEASIGVFHRLIRHADKIYLFDEDICRCFYIFSSEGDFIKRVKGYGEGPGFYQYPSSFQIIDDTIRLNDISQRKILLYDLNGNWINDLKQRFPANEFLIDNKGFEFYHSESYLLKDSKNEVRIFDSDGNLTFEGFPYDERLLPQKVKNRAPFIELEGGVLFLSGYADTLFLLEQFVKKPYLAFDFHGKGFKDSDLEKIQNFDHSELLDFINYKSPLHFDGRSVANERFFMGTFRYRDKAFLGIYDFRNNRGKIHAWGMVNDIDDGLKIYSLSQLDKDFVHGFTTGIDLYQHVQGLKSNMTEMEWEEFENGKGNKLVKTSLRAKDSENRVLIFMKWKK